MQRTAVREAVRNGVMIITGGPGTGKTTTINTLIKYFEYAKASEGSIVIHLNTIKGKGYKYAEEDNLGLWHGTGPFDINTGTSLNKNPNIIPWGKGIANVLYDILDKNNNVRIINPAMIVGTYFQDIQSKFPNQMIDVGINEEHAVVMAASMSRYGLIPIISVYSTFLQRAYDEICHDVCRSDNHVIFLLDHAGIVSGDGSTHQGVFDIPMLISMPNMVISTPSNLNEAKQLLEMAIKLQKPFAIRYPKDNIDLSIEDEEIKIEYGKWNIIKDIQDVNIISYGDTITELKQKLDNKIDSYNVGLINAIFVKPVDLDLLLKLKNKTLIIIEEVMKIGSLASLIMQYNYEYNLNINIKSFGVDEQYLNCGSRKELKEELGIDIDSIFKKI